MSKDFLRQIHCMLILDRIFALCTPAFIALAILASLAIILQGIK